MRRFLLIALLLGTYSLSAQDTLNFYLDQIKVAPGFSYFTSCPSSQKKGKVLPAKTSYSIHLDAPRLTAAFAGKARYMDEFVQHEKTQDSTLFVDLYLDSVKAYREDLSEYACDSLQVWGKVTMTDKHGKQLLHKSDSWMVERIFLDSRLSGRYSHVAYKIASEVLTSVTEEFSSMEWSLNDHTVLRIPQDSVDHHPDISATVRTGQGNHAVSGTWIGEGFFVCDYRYLLEASNPKVEYLDHWVEFSMVRISKDIGLALCQVEETDKKVRLNFTDSLAVPSELLIIGCAGSTDMGRSYSNGHLTGMQQRQHTKTYSVSSSMTREFSGAPVLNEQKELMGAVVVSSIRSEDTRSFTLIPVGVIAQELNIEFIK